MSKEMKGEMDEFSDELLVDQAKQGHTHAFMELALRYQERIYHTILALTQDAADTDDLTQETFMRAYKSLKHFKMKSSFYTWLYRIAVNLTLNFLRKRGKKKKTEVSTENHFYKERSDSFVFSPETNSLKKEMRMKLKEAIDSLPSLYKASFILVVFQGMTHHQAAQVLNCSKNTISWRLHRARKMLQEKLKPYFGEK